MQFLLSAGLHKVAWALDIRLSPLNADRAFVADSLVRAAFELGNPDAPLMVRSNGRPSSHVPRPSSLGVVPHHASHISHSSFTGI